MDTPFRNVFYKLSGTVDPVLPTKRRYKDHLVWRGISYGHHAHGGTVVADRCVEYALTPDIVALRSDRRSQLQSAGNSTPHWIVYSVDPPGAFTTSDGQTLPTSCLVINGQ